jgi:Bacterial toxin 8
MQGNGRGGKQARLRELANDDKVSSAIRGEIKRDKNEISRGKRSNIRVPTGMDLAHRRGKEARKGYSYKHSDLQGKDLHQLQHKIEGYN